MKITKNKRPPNGSLFSKFVGNSKFVLTIFGALVQEESANMSERVKIADL